MPLRNWLGLLILASVICLPIFAHLDQDFPLMIYDEGRLANNAVEMYEKGNLLVTTYDYQPDMWNTKPPMLIWLQALSLKIFGISDLSFRLPGSIAAVFTCFFIYFFSRRKLKAPWLGIIACTILISTPGYVRLHGIRTGDYDGMLTLFTTISVLCFYLFIDTGSRKQFWISVAALIMACLTKGVAGLLFAPAVLLYAIFKRKLVPMLRTKDIYLALLAFVVLVIGYYVLREAYNPGYIHAVLDNELGGRYTEGKEGHSQPFDFYFHSLVDFSFKPFLTYLVLGLVLAFVKRYMEYRGMVVYLFLCSLTFLLVISGGTTKHSWYVIPMLPLLSIISAVPIYAVCKALYESKWLSERLKYNVAPYLFIVLACGMQLKESIDTAIKTKGESEWLQGPEDMGRIFQKMLKSGYAYDYPMKAIFDDYQSPQKWYMKALRLKNIPVTELKDEADLQINDLLVVYNDSVENHFKTYYDVHVVEARGEAVVLQVHGRK